MSVGTNSSGNEFEFTLEEQWAMHQALLDYVEVAVSEETDVSEPSLELDVIEKIEANDFAFEPYELERLRYECDHHAKSQHTPDVDQGPARSVVEKIDSNRPSALNP